MLAALGSTARLKIFRLLLRAGQEGAGVSSLQHALGIPASTLNLHLAALTDVDRIAQQRVGRELRCRDEYADIRGPSAFLLHECCADVPGIALKTLEAA